MAYDKKVFEIVGLIPESAGKICRKQQYNIFKCTLDKIVFHGNYLSEDNSFEMLCHIFPQCNGQ